MATEKADCLVLGAFAVADAVGMAERADALAELRDSGVFDALLRTTDTRDDRDGSRDGSRVGVIPRRTRLFAQAVAGSNLNDARALRRIDARLLFSSGVKKRKKSGDVFHDSPPLTGGLCPAAEQMRVRARFREDTVTRVSDVLEMTKIPDAKIECTGKKNRRDWVPDLAPSALRARVPDDGGWMSWWWMDVGARWMDGGDGNEGMRDAVVLSSAPGDAASAPFRDRTVTFTASAPFPIATEKADGSVPGASDAVDARSANDKNACSCGAHALWGVDGVARWNDSESARRLARGIAEVTRRAGADRGALLDLSDGPRMSVLAASSFVFVAETNALRDTLAADADREFLESPKTTHTEKKNTVLCVERDAGSARFSRGVARASGFESDAVKVAALDPGGDVEGCFFFDDREALPLLEPANASERETHKAPKKKTTPVITGPDQRSIQSIDAHTTVTVRVGAGAEALDARLAEARADADVSAADASAAYRKSRAKLEAICAKLAATRDAYRTAVLAAMADVRLPNATPECHALEGDDFLFREVAFDAGYDPRPEDDFLFAAYCDRVASRSTPSRRDRSDARVTAELERLGLGGVDFEEVEADPRVARAAAVWLALAEALAEAEEAADADLTRAQEARLRAQAAAGQHAATLRGAAESALGKTPAWVFLCDPFSFVSFGPKSRKLSGALRWGDGALAETLRRRLWARRAGLLYCNHLSVPREAVIAVAAVSCPGLRARFEPELKGARALERASSRRLTRVFDDANEDEDAAIISSAAIALRERLSRAFAAPSPNEATTNEAFRERNIPASNDGPFGPFVPPTPTYLDDVAHAVVSRPAVAARVDLTGDGYDRARFAWGGGGDAVVEVSGSSLASPRGDNDESNAATVVDALVFWTEFDVGDGGPRLSTGPASVGSPNDKARRLLARDAQGVFFLDSALRLSESRSARFFVETRLELETENASLRGGRVGHVEARVRTTVTRGEASGRAS